MVAYSFKAMFAGPIASGIKRQTVRADRRRHARVGERLQLYTGMRTRQCRKIVDPDPVCVAVRPITIRIPLGDTRIISEIEVAGIPLTAEEIVQFAISDGFGEGTGCPRFKMGRFWLDAHGPGEFTGWVIEWRPEP